MGKRIVIGIGNHLMGDDAFGLIVVQRLKERYPDSSVEFIEGGTLGLDLLRHFERAEHLVLVDALDVGAEAGKVFLFDQEELAKFFHDRPLSIHDVKLPELLRVAKGMGVQPPRVSIVACQIKQVEQGIELSPEVSSALEEAEALVLHELGMD